MPLAGFPEVLFIHLFQNSKATKAKTKMADQKQEPGVPEAKQEPGTATEHINLCVRSPVLHLIIRSAD